MATSVRIELLLLLVASRQILVAERRHRHGRAVGLEIWPALEEGLAVLLPTPVARVVALEPRLWTCLAMWLFGRRRPGDGEFPYQKRSIVRSLLVVVVLTTPVELLLFELLIPWAWLRWLLLVGAVYLLVWAFAFHASLVVLPHRLEADGLRLRYGALAEGRIPYGEIASVALETARSPDGRDGLRLAPNEDAAYLAIGGRTDLTLWLRTARALRGVLGTTAPVTTVDVAADKPARLAGEMGKRVTAIAANRVPSVRRSR